MAYISKEDVKAIREELKVTFPELKFGVKKMHGGSNGVSVTIKSGKVDFTDCFTHGDGYIQVNEYHIDRHYAGKKREFFNELLAAMKGPKYFNDDDAMTDYFSRSHYTDINVGKWNKPYECVA